MNFNECYTVIAAQINKREQEYNTYSRLNYIVNSGSHAAAVVREMMNAKFGGDVNKYFKNIDDVISSNMVQLENMYKYKQDHLSEISTANTRNDSTYKGYGTELIKLNQIMKNHEQELQDTSIKIAEINAQKQNLQNDIDIAVQSNQALLATMNPKQVSFVLQKSLETADHKVFELVSNLNFDPNFQNGTNRDTLLHTAIKFNKPDLLEKVLAQHPNFSLQDIEGNTPLHLSLIIGNIEIAESLLKLGALVNIPNNAGKTATDIAQDNHYEAIYTTIIEKLDLEFSITVSVDEDKTSDTKLAGHDAESEYLL